MQSKDQSPNMNDEQTSEQAHEHGSGASTSGDELVNELGRLGRKFVEVAETAWNSEQRLQIQEELRKGLNNVASSLESGIHEVSEKEQTKEVIGKAEEVADEVVERLRASDFANELAAGLAAGLRTLGDKLDKLAQEIRNSAPSATNKGQATQPEESQDIPIVDDET